MEGKYIVMSHQYVYNNICMKVRTTNGYNYFISAATSHQPPTLPTMQPRPLDKNDNNENKPTELREMQQLLLPELTWREYRSQERRGEVGKLIGYFSKIYTLYTSQQGRFNSQFILRLLLVGDQKYFSKLFFLFLPKKSLRKAWVYVNWSDKPVLWMMPSKAWWLNSYYIIKNIIKHTLYREFMQHFSVSELILI